MELTLYTSFLFFTLILFPSLHLSTPTHPNHCFQNDQNTLLRIKKDFNNSTLFSTWVPGSDCCRWSGVACKKLPKTKTYRVNFLEVNFGLDIVGTIPSSVGDLPYLETLIIRGNSNLTGPIPPAIAKLTNVGLLLLNFNSLTGPIPSFLTKLTKLVTLELNDNQLTGTIPSFLGHMPQLSALDFSNNHLIGPIPSNLGLLPKLSFLTLTNNMLSGPIPRSLGNLNFEILELGSNRFTGDASFLFGESKTNYAHLGLEANKLSFDFSKVVLPVDSLNSSLLVFNMSHNMIYGRLPAWLGEAPVLYSLDVSYNRLCGAIPTIGGKLQGFEASTFEHNKCLCGAPLPPCKS
ncbi:hypothetical protein RND81_05G164600 [Saponaria officinalis]|uniref:Leucine-rich repeat-containing N-terminal plant-type domain-containing protein n=1 Tax=Saponaria officinalis TaxID=3572 RepID=A0AAW1KZY2_SAPOF